MDLNTLLSAGGGWVLQSASGIINRKTHALLTVAPETSSFALLACGAGVLLLRRQA